jgi:ribosome-dependent ATPase
LACDSPQKLIEQGGGASLEEVFIRYMEESIAAGDSGFAKPASAPAPAATAPARTAAAPKPMPAAAAKPAGTPALSGDTGSSTPAAPHAAPAKPSRWRLPLIRTLAYTRNETMQILRDPIRLTFAFVGSAVLMLVCGFGITTDVEKIRYATFDQDQTYESRAYLEQFAGAPRYFREERPARSADEVLERLQSDDVSMVLEIPPNFGRDLRRGSGPEVFAQVDGAMTFRGETVAQYVKGVHSNLLKDPSLPTSAPQVYTVDIQNRYMYNPTFESIYSIVPSVPALLLLLIPAILMTVAIVREKELGSMINFYVTPTGKIEYLVGKQLPYIAIGLINFFILAAMSVIVFGVPVKGNFFMLMLCTALYVTATTGLGMVTSTFTGSQVAAVFVTAILTITPTIQFSGLLQPVSTLEGSARVVGSIWPASYYMHSSLGAYTKGLGAELMWKDILFLAGCIPVFLAISFIGLRKQER